MLLVCFDWGSKSHAPGNAVGRAGFYVQSYGAFSFFRALALTVFLPLALWELRVEGLLLRWSRILRSDGLRELIQK